jgi:lactoylglutathione lyase
MPFNINHIHLKANDAKATADWWVNAFNFTIDSDTVRESGDRFISCVSENGLRVNISEPMEGQNFTPGDSGLRYGLEHFGLDSDDLETDIARLKALGATLLDGPIEMSLTVRIAFIEVPENVRVELIERSE